MIYTVVRSKHRFEYLCPRPEHILIEDIAHALSNLCRFTGHTSSFYSVAQHSVFVSQAVSPENALWGLMHDAQEAYVGDLAHPLKQIIDGNYGLVHDLIRGAICRKFGLDPVEPEEVKGADWVLCHNELWALLDPDYTSQDTVGVPRLFDEILCWSPREAKVKFLERFKELEG